MIAKTASVLKLDVKALKPTHPAMARKLPRIKTLKPFTLQLNYQARSDNKPLVSSVDTGSFHIGLSVVSTKKELFSNEVK